MIDVLIPTYNPKRTHLTAALEALQVQTNQEWRAYIHDDCSPNNETEEIVKPFLADSRINFKRSPVRLGIGGNWNACFSATFAPIVAYLFQDDVWAPDYLDAALKALNEYPSAGFISLEHRYHLEDGLKSSPLYEGIRSFRKENVNAGLHTGRNFLRRWIALELHPNIIGEPDFVVIRRGAMEQAGPFLEDMPQFLDTEYWLRLLLHADWANVNDHEYGMFRLHPSAATAVNQLTGQGLFDRLRCFERLIDMLTGDDKRLAIRARNHAVEGMVAKYFQRKEVGAKVGKQGKGDLRKFCLRHPLLIVKSIVKYFLAGNRTIS